MSPTGTSLLIRVCMSQNGSRCSSGQGPLQVSTSYAVASAFARRRSTSPAPTGRLEQQVVLGVHRLEAQAAANAYAATPSPLLPARYVDLAARRWCARRQRGAAHASPSRAAADALDVAARDVRGSRGRPGAGCRSSTRRGRPCRPPRRRRARPAGCGGISRCGCESIATSRSQLRGMACSRSARTDACSASQKARKVVSSAGSTSLIRITCGSLPDPRSSGHTFWAMLVPWIPSP